jgi:aryl-alcohol dehydrogenase-like predicted oxidoreductase
MQALRPLADAGLVRRVGVSNYGLARWQEAERTLRAPVVANQVRFSLVSPGPADDLVPYAAAMDRLVVAYSPLGQGLLSRGPGAADERPRGFRGAGRHFSARTRGKVAPVVAALQEIGDAHGATPAQVALAWVLHHPNTVAIPGARTVAQLEENAAAADLVLAEDEVATLTDLARVAAGRPRG